MNGSIHSGSYGRPLGAALVAAIVAAACSSSPPPSSESSDPIGVSQAALSIASLFGTGLDASGAALADGAVDPHYKQGLLAASSYVVDQNVYPLTGTWLPDGTTSKWIGIQATGGSTELPGLYTYTTTFSLASVDPTTASITGQWACDNSCTISLNGVVIPNTSPTYSGLVPFSVPTGSPFVTGTNTLTFAVTNSGTLATPTGLRVDGITGTAGCGQDSQCPTGQWCNNITSSAGVCQATVANGTAVPGGNCNATAGSALGTIGARACTTGACDTSDGKCGYANSDGPCVTGAVCRSTVCDTALGAGTGRCEACTATQTANCTGTTPICDSSTFTCVACNGDNGSSATADCPAATPYCPGGGAACTTCGTAGGDYDLHRSWSDPRRHRVRGERRVRLDMRRRQQLRLHPMV